MHSGVAVGLTRCTFVGNKAGEEGLAVLSLGIAENITEVVFSANTLHCSSGAYGYEMDAYEDEVKCGLLSPRTGILPPKVVFDSNVSKFSISCSPRTIHEKFSSAPEA